jgi:hypothetical protein
MIMDYVEALKIEREVHKDNRDRVAAIDAEIKRAGKASADAPVIEATVEPLEVETATLKRRK